MRDACELWKCRNIRCSRPLQSSQNSLEQHPAMDVPFLLTLLMKSRTHSARKLAWCDRVKWLADQGGPTPSLVFPHGTSGFHGHLLGVHLSPLPLWHSVEGTHAEMDQYISLANQLGAGKKSVCVLILVSCDTTGSYLLAGHQYNNVPEISVGSQRTGFLDGIVATDGMYLFRTHLPRRRLVGLVRAGTSLFLQPLTEQLAMQKALNQRRYGSHTLGEARTFPLFSSLLKTQLRWGSRCPLLWSALSYSPSFILSTGQHRSSIDSLCGCRVMVPQSFGRLKARGSCIPWRLDANFAKCLGCACSPLCSAQQL